MSRRTDRLKRRHPRPASDTAEESEPLESREPLGDELQSGRRSRAADSERAPAERNACALPRDAVAKAVASVERRERELVGFAESSERAALAACRDLMNARGGITVAAAGVVGDTAAPPEPSDEACALLFTTPMPPKNRAALVTSLHRSLLGGDARLPTADRGGSIDLTGVQIRDDAAFLAARGIQLHPEVQSVLLANTGLSDLGADILLATLNAVAPRRLTTLDLGGNRLTHRGAMAVVICLCGLFPPSRPAREAVTVNLEDMPGVVTTSPANMVAFADRVSMLQRSNVTVVHDEWSS